jgi:ABC-type transport system involved in cytochrome bd biosynthesis fused ATPase/permease subunit
MVGLNTALPLALFAIAELKNWLSCPIFMICLPEIIVTKQMLGYLLYIGNTP